MPWNDFGRSLLFALAAAVVSPALWHLTGHGAGLGVLWVVTSALYAYGLASGSRTERRVRGLGAAAAVGVAGAAGFALAPWLGGGGAAALAVVATTVALGWIRHRWLIGPNERRIVLEVGVGLGAIALGAWALQSVADPTLAFAAGLWGYFLVQSTVWLVTETARRPRDEEGDGFEHARRRLVRLLDERV